MGARTRRNARRVARVGLFLLATFLLFELALRVLLFSDAGWTRSLASSLRSPEHFTDRWSNRHWVLRRRFGGPEAREPPARFDARLGWVSQLVSAETYEHADNARVGERRPVLLYGDSFAACVSDAGTCWQSLLEESELASEYALLNYGTGGYGLDQALLLFESSIEPWLDRDPVVVIGILVDDDLDRSLLFLREWPKPRFEVAADGTLALDAPVAPDPERWIARHPLPPTSWALRWLVYGAGVLPRNETEWVLGRADHVQETKEISRRLLERLTEGVRARGLDAFVVLFHGERYVHETDWREEHIAAELARLRLPWVSSRLRLREDAARTGRAIGDYYLREGVGIGHYGELGNEAVFEAFARGLRGQFDE